MRHGRLPWVVVRMNDKANKAGQGGSGFVFITWCSYLVFSAWCFLLGVSCRCFLPGDQCLMSGAWRFRAARIGPCLIDIVGTRTCNRLCVALMD
ncbi:hypothetical protein AZ78_2761 [Lysobacter capsici AZ78]|uniref:Uncharacterized protein n=1 Tax=Lysobacter capsici AZ78 TaxID=1444315 RepID=A0A120AGW5_9GAMM|nr:hypothetical protein AZ78_2761 [Lysobacter capsici AZ78]